MIITTSTHPHADIRDETGERPARYGVKFLDTEKHVATGIRFFPPGFTSRANEAGTDIVQFTLTKDDLRGWSYRLDRDSPWVPIVND